MPLPAIRVANLSKQYKIGLRATGEYRTLRESLTGAFAAPFRHLRRSSHSRHLAPRDDSPTSDNPGVSLPGVSPSNLPKADNSPDTFWALNDVSFDVQPGEVVGIIGRNGAGKSTLLKILSRITEPTHGRVEMRGRVGSLLEVGTGFHPELTGRENVYMNGAILGMSKCEIARKFDEIVDFAEIDRFLETPVKRYSSGMYVRLAFAVAAHFEPQLLLVDEVLAVGDLEFQRKCLASLSNCAQSGRTVFLVSHNLLAIERLCGRVLLFSGGRLLVDGDASTAIQKFLNSSSNLTQGHCFTNSSQSSVPSTTSMCLKFAEVSSPDEWAKGQFPIGAPIQFRLGFFCPKTISDPVIGIQILSDRGLCITTLHSSCSAIPLPAPDHQCDLWSIRCEASPLILSPGTYFCRIELASNGQSLAVYDRALSFTVMPSDFFGNGGKQFPGDTVLCSQAWLSDN